MLASLNLKVPLYMSKRNFHLEIPFFWHGAYGIRTRGLYVANVSRSQLRQCPMPLLYHIFL